jgi:ribokinase
VFVPRIVVIGSLNMDLTVRASRLPRPGETVLGSDFYQAPGGKGGNQAVAAARLGARVRMAARVGPDAFGDALRASLEREGVDASAVGVAQAHTGVALIVVDAAGQNLIAVYSGANALLSASDMEALTWERGEWAVAVLEIPDAAVARGFERARGAGGRTILNAAPARPLPAELWPLIDVLVVNEGEAALLAGQPVPDVAAALAAARILQGRGPETVAVTLGAEGAVLVDRAEAWHIPAVPVQAVDATAAGDAWVGAVAVALARGEGLLPAALFAAAAGAITATRPGAQPALPYLAEVREMVGRVPRPQRLA